MTLKIKVGWITLLAQRDVNLPQEHAAWFETVRVEPGTYDVFAYIGWTVDGGGMYRVHSLSAQAEGTTIASYYGNRIGSHYSKDDNNRNGKRTTAHIQLPTFGVVAEPSPRLAQATLTDAIVRTEWDAPSHGRMWRFTWNKDVKVRATEQGCSGATVAGEIVI